MMDMHAAMMQTRQCVGNVLHKVHFRYGCTSFNHQLRKYIYIYIPIYIDLKNNEVNVYVTQSSTVLRNSVAVQVHVRTYMSTAESVLRYVLEGVWCNNYYSKPCYTLTRVAEMVWKSKDSLRPLASRVNLIVTFPSTGSPKT